MMKIREVFSIARQLPPGEEREAYLDQACAGNPDMRNEVVVLLQAEHDADEFLNQDAVGNSVHSPETLLGKFIGHYRVVEHLGEGGFGDVYRVEQSQPIHRELAMKILKPGMASREIEARFLSERETLALMDHPNISRILDAGTTDDGRLYFVMDLVPGTPITRYCDDHHLTLVQRLELFQTVCSAVEHAHLKGILHRDLKPSNIVVVEIEGKPVPKIIDFGIAKAMKGELKERALDTQVGMFMGTPAYMSPEQIKQSSDSLDTRSDIYSLGVLLYELVAGVQPFEGKTMEGSALVEVQRIICEVDPDKPTTLLRKIGDRARTIAELRASERSTLIRTIKGDLDWIIMKAIDKDRTRRYQGVGQLARDIERHLRHQTIEAGAPGSIYRLRKFSRRHVFGMAVVAVLSPVLLISLIISLIGFSRARLERDHAVINELMAQAEAVKRSTFREHLLTLLLGDPESRQLLANTDFLFGQQNHETNDSARTILIQLKELPQKAELLLENHPVEHAQIHGLVADSYLSLDLKLQAWEHYEKMLEILGKSDGPDSIAYANALLRYAQSINFGYNGQITLEGSGYPEHFDWLLVQRGKPREHELLRQALNIYRRHNHLDKNVLVTMMQLAGSQSQDSGDTEILLRQLAEAGQALYGEEDFRSLLCKQQLALYLIRKGRTQEARPICERLEEAYKKNAGPYWYPCTGISGLAQLLEKEGDLEGAEQAIRDNIQRLEEIVRGEYTNAYITNLKMLFRLLHKQGRTDAEVYSKLARIGYNRGFDPTSSRVDYKLRITDPGVYRLHLRYNGHNPFSDSLSVRIIELGDGLAGETADFYGFTMLGYYGKRENFTSGTFDIGWDQMAYFEGPFYPLFQQERIAAEWHIKEPGEYTIQFMEMESGVALDAFVFQLNTLPEPDLHEMDRSVMDANGAHPVKGGSVLVEAEDYTLQRPGRVTDWRAIPDEEDPIAEFTGISGRGYLQVLPEQEWIGLPGQ